MAGPQKQRNARCTETAMSRGAVPTTTLCLESIAFAARVVKSDPNTVELNPQLAVRAFQLADLCCKWPIFFLLRSYIILCLC